MGEQIADVAVFSNLPMSSPGQVSEDQVTAVAGVSKPVTPSDAQPTEVTVASVKNRGALEYAPAGKRISQVMMVAPPIDQ